MIACPLVPLMSLITLAGWIFHLGQRFLHLLNLPPGVLYAAVPQSPDRPCVFHILLQTEQVAHQPVSVQFHKPLALLHVGFSSRHILCVLCVYQRYPDTVLFENVVQRDPVPPVACIATVSTRQDFSHFAI